MALEIRELVIKVSVHERPQARQQQETMSKAEQEKLKKSILNDCIEAVLDRLDLRIER